MMRLISYFLPSCPRRFVYMLQLSEYKSNNFLKWLARLPRLDMVAIRGKLEVTARAKLLLAAAVGGWLLPLAAALIGLIVLDAPGGILVLILAMPVSSAITLIIVNALLARFVVKPAEEREIAHASHKLEGLSAHRIAVLGSYGKTTMKDLLETVLSAGLRVRATPGNKNVLISHARWINNSTTEDDEVLILEYGEGQPGSIAALAELSRPQIAVITGLAPAHLDSYGTLDAVAEDLADIIPYAGASNVYGNAESAELMDRVSDISTYSINGVNGWKTSDIKASIEGTAFSLKKGSNKLHLKTNLIGLHQLGPLCAVTDIAIRLGLTDKQIEEGVAATKPFEHRMQPYQLGGAWVIDDTYNGNIEGMRAGLRLLAELEASGRKIYVTPGLVEQGDLKQAVHESLGRLIAEAKPDRVVLMRNSVTAHIQAGLEAGGYEGDLLIEGNPLSFYTNLEHFIAAGDLVLMQNDWTDNYA